jgi:hypothetical protein
LKSGIHDLEVHMDGRDDPAMTAEVSVERDPEKHALGL